MQEDLETNVNSGKHFFQMALASKPQKSLHFISGFVLETLNVFNEEIVNWVVIKFSNMITMADEFFLVRRNQINTRGHTWRNVNTPSKQVSL